MEDPKKALAFALQNYPERVETAPIADLLLDAARPSGKRPAYIKLAVPDEVVKSVRGHRPSADLVFLVRLPRQIVDRAESPIILPDEVG